ncbi:MAG: molybdopterin cofactor-binding domain-containing protein [Burkholderiales bacterium]
MSERPKLPGNLETNRRLDQWVRFGPDRTVTILTGKIEIGQGIVTTLAQIAAEELDVAVSRIRMAPIDTLASPNEGHTSASRSTDDSGTAVRYACAEVRELLLREASVRLDIPFDKLTVQDGVIGGYDRIREVSYWDLPHAEILAREATASVKPKPSAQLRVVGTNVPRLDIPAKVAGLPCFVHDFELPGMLFGRVVRPPTIGSTLESFDRETVARLPGVVTVCVDGNFIGVVAEREEQAVKARDAALREVRWKHEPLATDADAIYDYLQSRESPAHVLLDEGVRLNMGSGLRQNDDYTTLKARYTKPYLAHAALGPSCALARVEGERIEMWTHSQGVYPLRADIARVLEVAPERIEVHHMEGAGCYGHNGADDAALDAVLLSRACGGRPVQVQYMRDDEFLWEPYGPAMVVETQATLDAEGRLVEWCFDDWSNGHTSRPARVKTERRISALRSAWEIGNPAVRIEQADAGGVGGISRNAMALYDFPGQRVVTHRVEEVPLRTSSMRSLGAYANVFASESFMDELAKVAGRDPVEFRLAHMKEARARAVIERAVQKAGWQPGVESDGTWGRGFAFAQFNNAYGYFAIVVELALEPKLKVARAVCAVDVGRAINPDGILNQMEGGIVQAVSWTLHERVRFDASGVHARDFESYPILRFDQVPEIEVHLIDRPDEPPLGAGEMTMGPTAAAIGNAVHHALGLRLRDLPLSQERIEAALR